MLLIFSQVKKSEGILTYRANPHNSVQEFELPITEVKGKWFNQNHWTQKPYAP